MLLEPESRVILAFQKPSLWSSHHLNDAVVATHRAVSPDSDGGNFEDQDFRLTLGTSSSRLT